MRKFKKHLLPLVWKLVRNTLICFRLNNKLKFCHMGDEILGGIPNVYHDKYLKIRIEKIRRDISMPRMEYFLSFT